MKWNLLRAPVLLDRAVLLVKNILDIAAAFLTADDNRSCTFWPVVLRVNLPRLDQVNIAWPNGDGFSRADCCGFRQIPWRAIIDAFKSRDVLAAFDDAVQCP